MEREDVLELKIIDTIIKKKKIMEKLLSRMRKFSQETTFTMTLWAYIATATLSL